MSHIADVVERRLYEEALALTERAYAPYSGFRVGAVVVGASGAHYHGVNVESVSSPAGLCAEGAALAAAVTAGEREVRAVAVAAAGERVCLPCGVCRQALVEFGDPLVIARAGDGVRAMQLSELFPSPFDRSGL